MNWKLWQIQGMASGSKKKQQCCSSKKDENEAKMNKIECMLPNSMTWRECKKTNNVKLLYRKTVTWCAWFQCFVNICPCQIYLAPLFNRRTCGATELTLDAIYVVITLFQNKKWVRVYTCVEWFGLFYGKDGMHNSKWVNLKTLQFHGQ